MKLSIKDARALSSDIFVRNGMSRDHADVIADHLVYAEASGEVAGGIARTLSLVDEYLDRPAATDIEIVAKTTSGSSTRA